MPGRGGRRRGKRKFTAFQERASHRQQNIKRGQLRRPPSPVAPDAPFTADESAAIQAIVANLPPIPFDDHLDRPPADHHHADADHHHADADHHHDEADHDQDDGAGDEQDDGAGDEPDDGAGDEQDRDDADHEHDDGGGGLDRHEFDEEDRDEKWQVGGKRKRRAEDDEGVAAPTKRLAVGPVRLTTAERTRLDAVLASYDGDAEQNRAGGGGDGRRRRRARGPTAADKKREASERAILGLADDEIEPLYDVLASIIAEAEPDAEAHQEQVRNLGASQQEAYRRIVETHESVFVTGGAGKGKTHLLRCVIQGLRQAGRTVAVLAPTGVAAHHIQGTTVHSFLHLPPAWFKRTLSGVIAALRKKPEKLVRFQIVETIVIDEISMVPAKLLHWMNRIMQVANNTTLPFGGRQVIVCGDFYQLPPVSEPPPEPPAPPRPPPSEEDAPPPPPPPPKSGAKRAEEEAAPFCFETEEWRAMFPATRCIELRENFRQKDPKFIELLNRARVGILSDADLLLLRKVWTTTRARLDIGRRRLPSSEAAGAALDPAQAMRDFRVRLFGLCAKVEKHNETAERSIRAGGSPGRTYHTTFHLRAWTEKQLAHIDHLRDWFEKNRRYLTREKRLYHIEHLAQFDVTYDEAREKLDDELPVPEAVRLSIGSRVMLLKNWKTAEGLVHGRTGWVTGFGDEGPMVAFDADRAGEPPLEVEVPPLPWTAICDGGRLVATQVPLSYAWGITVHKSQGLSMPRADMDLGYLFAPGQGYVALSRLTSLEGLGLIDFDPTRVFCDPRVTDFYQRNFPGPIPKRPNFFPDPSLLPPQPHPTPVPTPHPRPPSASPPPRASPAPPPPPPPGPTAKSPPTARPMSGVESKMGRAAPAPAPARFATDEERAETEELLMAEFGPAFVERLRQRAALLGIDMPPAEPTTSSSPTPTAARFRPRPEEQAAAAADHV